MFILSPENSFPPKGATRPQAELLFLRNSSLSLADRTSKPSCTHDQRD